MSETKKFPIAMIVNITGLVLVAPLIWFVIWLVVPYFTRQGEQGVAAVHFIVALLALMSAIAIAIGESIHGIDRSSEIRTVRISGWFKIVGYGALIASAAYLVSITWAVL